MMPCYGVCMTVTSTITIAAPIERVWELFTDFPNAAERIQGISKMEFLEKDGRAEVGMKWRETRVMFGKEATEVMWITDLQPNRSYVVEAESHGVHYTSTYTFTPTNGGTQVTLTFGGEPQTFMARVMGAIMAPLMSGSIKKMLLADMEDLKKVAEAT